jgi:hypothetical protein
MTDDRKICDVALAYIRKAARREEWPHTFLGKLHPSLIDRLRLEDRELVLVSAFFSPESWYRWADIMRSLVVATLTFILSGCATVDPGAADLPRQS